MGKIISFLLDMGQTPDSWGTLNIYKGSGALNDWSSFGILAGVMLALGIMIRGTVFIFRAIKSPSPGETLNGLIQLVIGIVVVVVLWKITGAN